MKNKSENNYLSPEYLITLFIFFLSGFSALVYEVLWLKELGLLFGNTAYAAATTLSVFFLGLSAGGYFWGKKAAGIKNPLRVYGAIELGIAVSALLYFFLLDIYYLVYTPLYAFMGYHPLLFTSVKFVSAVSLLFLPAFFMGGTFPIIGQYFIRQPEQLGKTGSLLYAINTAGAALGAFVAGFYLPLKLGYKNSYIIAVSLNVVIAITAYLISLSKKTEEVKVSVKKPLKGKAQKQHLPLTPKLILSIAFISGFTTLGLEVLWTRMFAQVLQNSVYSFSAILVTFLLALAFGSVLAHFLCRLKTGSYIVLSALLALSGIMAGVSPLIFYKLSNGMTYISNEGWTGYVHSIFITAAAVIFIPVVLMGSVLPYLLKMSQRISEGAGKTIGQLVSINTVGAMLGSLFAGFVLLSYVGLWASIKLMAFVYFITAIFIIEEISIKRLAIRALPALGLILFVYNLYSSKHPVVTLNPQKKEILYEVWEGSHGTVAVVKEGKKDIKIRVNNHYSLGSLIAFKAEQRQAQIPLLIHPDPQSVFFLGLGTGITAGAALDFPVKKIVTCELIPEVVTASKKYFNEFTNGLFDDERSKIVIGDGRNYLLGSPEKYDVIVSDLFKPWDAGTGSLYSKEHFQTVKSRLNKGGVFAQWLPLFQTSKVEFSIIVKTMLEVFPQATLWRGNTVPRKPIVAIIAQNEYMPLRTKDQGKNAGDVSSKQITFDEMTPFIFYAGNLAENKSLFESYPVNTDDRPLIEYLSPITQRDQKTKKNLWFTSFQLMEFQDKLFNMVSPEEDPYLKNLTPREVNFIRGGASFFKVRVYRRANKLNEARLFYKEFQSLIPLDIFPDLK